MLRKLYKSLLLESRIESSRSDVIKQNFFLLLLFFFACALHNLSKTCAQCILIHVGPVGRVLRAGDLSFVSVVDSKKCIALIDFI